MTSFKAEIWRQIWLYRKYSFNYLSVLALVMRRQSQTTSPSSVKLVSSSRLVMKSQLFLVLQLVLRWHSNLDYSIIRRVGFRVSPFLFYM